MRRLVSASLLFIAAAAAGCGSTEIETAQQPAANAAKSAKADEDQAAADKVAKSEADAKEEAQARADFEAYQASVARNGGARASYIGYLPINCIPLGIPVDGPGCVPLPPPISLPAGIP